MDILETALDIEKLSIAFYRQLEQEADLESVRRVAAMLAAEEETHADVIRGILEGPDRAGAGAAEPERDALWAGLVESFAREIGTAGVLQGSLVRLFARGMELERRTIELYETVREAVPGHQEELDRLLAEEERHRDLLDGFLELARTAEEWVENPEFSHLGEEY